MQHYSRTDAENNATQCDEQAEKKTPQNGRAAKTKAKLTQAKDRKQLKAT